MKDFLLIFFFVAIISYAMSMIVLTLYARGVYVF